MKDKHHLYSDKARQHAAHPRNRHGLPQATSRGESEYLRCGDKFKLFLRVSDGVIRNASFEAQSCPAVIAVGSLGTELLVGYTTLEASKITSFDLDALLEGLPPAKRHAYLLFLDSLHQALGQESQVTSNPTEGDSHRAIHQ